MRIRTLIVDDEPLARRRIRALLRAEADVFVVGECGDGESASRAIVDLKPDLVFLDIQMPGMNGFEALRPVEGHRLPDIIFVTAHDRYALRAFDHRAIDYLLKPFSRARFQEAVRRARERHLSPQAVDRQTIADLLRQAGGFQEPGTGMLLIKVDNRFVLVDTARIDRIESERDYVRIFVGPESYLTRETMNNLEARLNPDKFLRVHRSTLVNVRAIRELQLMPGGDYVLAMTDGAEITLSRRYRSRAETLFRRKL